MPDLLIELLSEEIPARMQTRASADLKRLVTDGMVEAGLTYAAAEAFATPRRLTLAVAGVSSESPTTVEERKGPRADAPEKALEGFLRSTGLSREQLEERETPKGAVLFARITKPGRPAPDIVAEVLEATIRSFPWPKSMRWGGEDTPGAGRLRWVRPLQSILCILSEEAGAEVVPLAFEGFTSTDRTVGHRFMAPESFLVTGFEDYAAKLKRAHVVLDPSERADAIWHEATNLAFAQGLEVVEDKGLLGEVAGLVEWPVPLMGEIGEDFLGLPPEVLQTSMKEHQKFFSVREPKSGQIVRFVTVANRETADHGATILAGNRKVLAARLSDAKFFWENDLRTVAQLGLEGMAAPLANVTFERRLGSQADRIVRIADLAREIAPAIGASPDLAAEAARVCKADLASEMVYEFPELQGTMGRYYAAEAGLAPEIAVACEEHYSPLGPSDAVPEGAVSRAVALADKIDTLTGFWAIDEKPTGSKDPFALRRAALGVIRILLESGVTNFRLDQKIERAALAHILTAGRRLDGGFAALLHGHDPLIGQSPDNRWKEPHFKRFLLLDQKSPEELGLIDVALAGMEFEAFEDSPGSQAKARAELQAARLQATRLDSLVGDADFPPTPDFSGHSGHLGFLSSVPRHRETWSPICERLSNSLMQFIVDRLKVYLAHEGLRHDVIDACLAMKDACDLVYVTQRARALQAVLGTEDGENLIQGFKRANNILRQAEEADGVAYEYGPDPKFAETDEERALFAALDKAEAAIAPALAAEDFATAMAAMAGLRTPIDAFFEAVQVNTDNQIIRRNRLNLLHRITDICGQVADLTKLS